MKKKLCFALLLSLLLCLVLPLSAFAETLSADTLSASALVTDEAGILSADEVERLESVAAQVSAQYGCGVYIITLDDYRSYGSNVESAAEAIYRARGLGYGAEKNGILLLLSMDDRDYDLAAHGAAAHTAFTDYGKGELADSFLPYLGRNDWAGGFEKYVNNAAYLLQRAAEGDPVDIIVYDHESEPMSPLMKLLLSLVPAGLISGGTCLGMRGKMKNAKIKTTAEDYVVPGSLHLSVNTDRFLHTTRTVVKDPPPESRGGGGGHSGGTSINSGGFSHHSGKF